MSEKWNKILEVRSLINDELDKQRKANVLKSSQEAVVKINPSKMSESQRETLGLKIDWPFVLQMAEVHMHDSGDAVSIGATKFAKCERCWRHREDVGSQKNHPTLCSRCESAVSHLVAG